METNTPTKRDTTINHVGDSVSDVLWFAHYKEEKTRLITVQCQAGNFALMARKAGDRAREVRMREIESLANVSTHAVNSALIAGGF